MASRRKYRKMWLRWNKQYERRSYRDLQKTFHMWTDAINWDQLDENGYKIQIDFAMDENIMKQTYFKIYTEIGIKHGNRVGKTINRQLKNFTPDAFRRVFLSNITEFLTELFGFGRITTVKQSFFDEIVKLLGSRLDNGMTIQQAAREIQRIVSRPNFYRYQALRIARTETTAAANYAATQASEVSGFKMEKEWISAQDARTRRPPESHFDHVHMNGERVPEKEPFDVSGEKLMYPGDPKGSAGNVINCRCAVAVIAARDANGSLIPV